MSLLLKLQRAFTSDTILGPSLFPPLSFIITLVVLYIEFFQEKNPVMT